jgi:Fervidolysin N-terminal prodomain
MKSASLIFVLALSFILSIFLSGCKESDNPILPPKHEYVPGQIVVKFNESVSDSFFNAFIDSLGLEIYSRNYDSYFFWVETPKDSADYYASLFRNKWPLFIGVSVSTYPYEDIDSTKGYISMTYKTGLDASDISEGENYIDSLGLTLKRVTIIPIDNIFAVILVPIGKELYWIDQLSKCTFIDYAELNYITRGH